MFLLFRMVSTFSIIATLYKIEYKFKNGVMLEIPKKLISAVINLLVCFLIVEVSYARSLLITKLMFIGIEFEILKEASCTYNDLSKLGKEIKLS